MKFSIGNNIFCLFIALAFVCVAQSAPGDLDTTFNGTGKSALNLGGGRDGANAVVTQSDGKIVVVGSDGNTGSSVGVTGQSPFIVARYNSDGSPDSTFGDLSKVVLFTNEYDSDANGVAIQSDGKIVAVGTTCTTTTDCRFTVIRLNSDGSSDTSFNGTGLVRTTFPLFSGEGRANAVKIQTDGKIVVVGSAFLEFAIAIVRYNTNGSLDTTFGTNGVRLDRINESEVGNGVVIQSDGKIVTVGTSAYVDLFPGSTQECLGIVRRYNTNGIPDTTFDGDGIRAISDSISINDQTFLRSVSLIVQTGVPNKIVVAGYTGRSQAQFVAIGKVFQLNANGSDDSGFTFNPTSSTKFSSVGVLNSPIQSLTRIIVTGNDHIPNGATSFLSARIKPDGSLDDTFGTNGTVKTPILAPYDLSEGNALATRSGKIIIAGISQRDFAIVRYNTDGSLDTDFGIAGKVIEDVGVGVCEANGVVSQPDGKVVVAGKIGQTASLVRYKNDGSLDETFSGDGRFFVPRIDTRSTELVAVARQPDGKIVAVGSSSGSQNSNIIAVRVNADGTPDTTFDGDGIAVITGSNTLKAFSLALQTDGKIVIAGESRNSVAMDSDFLVMRLNTNGTPDLTFDADGIVTTSFGTLNDNAKAVLIQTDGKIVGAGTADGTFAAARYNPDGSLDTSFNFDGKVTTPIGSSSTASGGNSITLQSDGKVVVAGKSFNGADHDFALLRYTLDGNPDTTFGSGGVVIKPVGTGEDSANSIVVEPSGSFLVAGSASDLTGPLSEDFAILRYNSNGTLDTSFVDSGNTDYGNGGIVLVDFAMSSDAAKAITLDPFGKAVVVGKTGNPSRFAVARLLGFAPTAANVGVSGRVFTPEGRGLQNAFVTMTDSEGNTRFVRSNSFGYFRFNDVEVGQTYIISVNSKSYRFVSKVLTIDDELSNLNLIAIGRNGLERK